MALTSVALASVALASVALTSVALTSAAMTWFLTRSVTWYLTILGLINIALRIALSHDLAILAVINVTDKCDLDMDSGVDWL
jgi:hypothetical protein